MLVGSGFIFEKALDQLIFLGRILVLVELIVKVAIVLNFVFDRHACQNREIVYYAVCIAFLPILAVRTDFVELGRVVQQHNSAHQSDWH